MEESIDPNEQIREKVLSELDKLIKTTRDPHSKNWHFAEYILESILTSDRINIQFSTLELAVDGNVLKNIYAHDFIYSLLRYNKKIPVQDYSIILSHLQLPEGLIKNRNALEIIQQSQFNSTTVQTGSGRHLNNDYAQNSRNKQALSATRNRKRKWSTKSLPTKWITL